MRSERVMLSTLICALLTAATLGGCGIQGVEGNYTGTVSGQLTSFGIPIAVFGDLDFDLVATGEDNYSATGLLKVKNKSTGQVTYEADLGGGYAVGDLEMSFSATDGKSSGSMRANTLAGKCWQHGSWTIKGFATSGSGTWSGCRSW